MDERERRDREIAASERDIDALFAPLARRLGEALRRLGEAPLDSLGYALVQRELDAALAEVFGRWEGDPAAGLTRVVDSRVRRLVAAELRRHREHVVATIEERDPELAEAVQRA